MELLQYIFLFLIFPGFLFSAAMGLVVGWVDRKVTARVQWRVGPPWYQNFIDVAKLLFYKETLIPVGAPKSVFLGMPLVALSGATLVSTIILYVNGAPDAGFIGDLIVVVYLLMIPAIALMIGAFSSGNALASLGASREMKLMLSYELPFVLALAVPIMKANFSISFSEILAYQANSGAIIGSFSGILSFIVMILCVQAKLGFTPFDAAEAETEIVSGPFIEYSGKALGALKLSKAVLTFALPILMITLYFGGVKLDPRGCLNTALVYILIVVVMVVIKNTNPRLRIDQIVRFFWGPVTALAAAGIALAYFGY